MNVVAWFVATVVTLPFLGWYCVYFTTVKLTKNKIRAVRLASDGTTILFMAAVYFIMYELWDRSFLWIILSAFLVIASVFTWTHWKIAEDIHTKKLFKGIWRLNFIFFLLFYILLSGYGLIFKIIS